MYFADFSALKSTRQLSDIISAIKECYQANDINCQEYTTTKNIRIACHSGCYFCCNFKVDARAYEIFTLSEYITSHFSASEKTQLMTALYRHKSHLSQFTADAHISTNVPCPMLVDGNCSVYPVRPFACRAYYSLDVSSCQYSVATPGDLEERRPTDPELDSQWADIRNSVAAYFQQSGYDVAVYELGTSLLSSLLDSKHQKRWIKHKKAFVGLCTYQVN